jgi:multisubunit Na+/H+ antiporter MnhG subunit
LDAKTIFYIVGAALAVLAVAISFVGIRDKDFPPAGSLGRVILAVFAVLVVGSAAYAIASAREEQRERREHLAEAQEEAEAEGEAPAEEPAEEQPAEEEPAGGDEGGDELATQGADVFAANGCGSCHVLAAANSTGAIGPDLDEALAGKDAAYIEEAIVDPDATIAEGFNAGIMPATFGDDISPEDLEALIAYLEFAVSQS